MKRKIFPVLIFLFFFGFFSSIFAQGDFEINFFYREGCFYCKKEIKFLEEIKEKYPEIKINYYEIYHNPENQKLFQEFAKKYELKHFGVPILFIGDRHFLGYESDETTGKAIESCLKEYCGIGESDEKIINISIFKEVNLSKFSLPVLTIVLGAVDGFNPCAMWVLLFLIALLLNTRSRKKMFQVGGIFVLASGIIYFIFMTAWLNLFLAVGYLVITRLIIGFLALGIGIWRIRDFFIYKHGVCKVAGPGAKWHERMVQKVQEVVKPSALPVTILGVIALAFGVNLIELFCSAGLPAVYTNILSLSNLSAPVYYFYLFLYTFVFMLDDMIIFSLAIITLSKVGFTEKYSKWTALFGGVLIAVLGIILIFRPELLMFG